MSQLIPIQANPVAGYSFHAMGTTIRDTSEKIYEWAKPYFQKMAFYIQIAINVAWSLIKDVTSWAVSKTKPLAKSLVTELAKIYHTAIPIIENSWSKTCEFAKANPITATIAATALVVTGVGVGACMMHHRTNQTT